MTGVSTTYSSQIYPSAYSYSAVSENKQPAQPEKQAMMLMNNRLGAVKMPKAEVLRTFWQKVETKFGQWLERYNQRPHRYNTDKLNDAVNLVSDLTDNKKDKSVSKQPAALQLRA